MSSDRFYAPDTQPVVGPVVLLPQEGSSSGGTNRPLNSYAVLREGRSILFDAPVSWALEGIRALAAEGRPPRALVISHKDLASSGDAFDLFREEFDAPVLMHPADQTHPAAQGLGLAFQDPMESAVLAGAGARVIHMPGHTPGSIMLYLADEGGILLAGDSAVAPGPEQAAEPPRLERPKMAEEAERPFLDAWEKLAARLPLAAVLPLHGRRYLRAELGSEAFDAAVANLWRGPPMDPSGGS